MISSSTLSAIQKVGQAAFAADERLKKEAAKYSDLVHAAITKNPYNLGNDTLIENWKIVARLSQTLAGIEDELKKVFQVASELIDEEQPLVREVQTLAGPEPVIQEVAKTATSIKTKQKAKGGTAAKTSKSKNFVIAPSVAAPPDLDPIDVIAKLKVNKKKLVPVKAKAKKIAKESEASAELKGNAAKLMSYLERTLSNKEFKEINQTEISHETGIPLGSMTASLKKLVALERIAAGDVGAYQLVEGSAQA